jgi:urate oxidase
MRVPEKLVHDSYGKSDIRVTKVIRRRGRHDLVEISVDVALQGQFQQTYLTGDNQNVVATDSMKNTVYALAAEHPLDSIESFALDLVAHFLKKYSQVTAASATIRQHNWQRISRGGKLHRHAFISGGSELRHCNATGSADAHKIVGGLSDMVVLKTTDSGFAGFVRDEFTTLKETDDRIFATAVSATWTYSRTRVDYNRAFNAIREALLETFAHHESLSVQQTLYAMGKAALKRCAAIESIDITMPNRHRILVNLEPFGLKNENEIFVWTDEPYGEIYGSIARS